MNAANAGRWVLLCGALVMLLAGCDFCGFGGGSDTPPEETLVMLTLEVEADTSSTQLANVVELDRTYSLYSFTESFRKRKVSIHPDARSVLVERTLYEIPLDERYAIEKTNLPDSLNACSFTFDATKPLLCAITRKDSTFNPVNGQIFAVDAARAYVGALTDERVHVLVADTARFFSKERYRIDQPEQAVLSADGQTLVVLMHQETRQIVTDVTGAVVNDFVFASERRLLVMPVSNPASTAQLPLDLLPEEGEPPQIAVSDDGAYVATAHDGTIRLVALADPSQVTVLLGYHPMLARGRLLVTPDPFTNQTLLLYNLADGSQTRITSQKQIESSTLHPATGRVYYIAQDEVWYYDPASAQHVLVYAFSQYLRQRDAMTPEFSVNGRGLFYVAPLPGQPDQIAIFGGLAQYYISSGDC